MGYDHPSQNANPCNGYIEQFTEILTMACIYIYIVYYIYVGLRVLAKDSHSKPVSRDLPGQGLQVSNF